MTKRDQLGPVYRLRFDSLEYSAKHKSGAEPASYHSHGWVWEETEVSPLEINSDEAADIGNLALYAAYISFTEDRPVAIKYRDYPVFSLSDSKNRKLPHLSLKELDTRLERWKTEKTVTEGDRHEMLEIAFATVVGFNLKHNSKSPARLQFKKL